MQAQGPKVGLFTGAGFVAGLAIGVLIGWSVHQSPRPPAVTVQNLSIPAPATTHAVTTVPDDKVEIVSVDAKVTESNDVWWKLAWQLTLHNQGSNPVIVDATINFSDSDGYIIDDDAEYGLQIAAGETKTFTGYDLIRTEVAPNIKRIGAKVRPSY